MRKFSYVISIIALVLFMVVPQAVFADEEDTTLQYVALGDSLAHGMNEVGAIENGYPVYISQYLEESTNYDVTLTNHGVSGATTVNVLEQLADPVVQASLAEADFVTLTAGANDALGAVDLGNLDEIDQEHVLEVIGAAGMNTAQIVGTIQQLNPGVPVFVMGYYNALPYLEDYQPLIIGLIGGLNEAIETGSTATGATFVPTFHVFEGNYEELLPNPDNIHPNDLGYQAIAAEFLPYVMEELGLEVIEDDESDEDGNDEGNDEGNEEEDGSNGEDAVEEDEEDDATGADGDDDSDSTEEGTEEDDDSTSDETIDEDETEADDEGQATDDADEDEAAAVGDQGEGKRLPDTATDMYMILLIGGMFIVVGGALFIISRRQNVA